MHRRAGVGALLVTAALTVVITSACSGDDVSSAETPPSETTGPSEPDESTTDSVPPDIAATTTSTAPATTSPPTTTSSTTTANPTTTTEPEPTLDELEAEVAAAYDDIYEGYWACLRSPLQCDTSWLVEGSGSADAMQATMQGLADRDRFVGDDPVGYYVIESIEFDTTRTEATVTSCWWSTAVLYTTPADPSRPPGPDNPPTIVNDRPGTSVQQDQLSTGHGLSWRISSSRTLESVGGEDLCESRSQS